MVRESSMEKQRRKLPVKVNLEKALDLHLNHGLNYMQIAKMLGCSEQAVQNRLSKIKKVLTDRSELEYYRQNRIDVLEGLEWKILGDLSDPKKRKRASYGQQGLVLAQVNNIKRLEQGKSTHNIAYIKMLQESKAQRENLMKEVEERKKMLEILENQELSQISSNEEHRI